MSRFNHCLTFVLKWEGGKTDDPIDRGGRTAYGITQREYKKGDVWNIAMPEVEAIYWQDYWLAAKCQLMPDDLDLCVFDSAVQHGPVRAIKFLQQALGIGADGVCGPVTIDALQEEVAAGRVQEIVDQYIDNRHEFYDKIIANDPTQARFEAGWAHRMASLSQDVMA